MHLVKRMLVCIAIGFLALTAAAQSPPTGLNCENASAEPPEGSGENYAQVTQQVIWVFRVFPRLSELEQGYTGCQVLWTVRLPDAPEPTMSLVFYKNGKAQFIWPKPPEPICEKGESTATGCMLPAQLIPVSFPAGCLARAAQAGKMPADCTESFNQEFDLKERVHVQRAKQENAP